jgi:hypothetical protein
MKGSASLARSSGRRDLFEDRRRDEDFDDAGAAEGKHLVGGAGEVQGGAIDVGVGNDRAADLARLPLPQHELMMRSFGGQAVEEKGGGLGGAFDPTRRRE